MATDRPLEPPARAELTSATPRDLLVGPAASVQIRLHGRGGQGTVTAAELLSVAAFEEGLHAQAFPSFGSERMGAPVEAYCRVSKAAIRTREPVSAPDVLIIQDATLIEQVDVFSGLRHGGLVLINTTEALADLPTPGSGTFDAQHVLTVPATELAQLHLGRPTPNSVLLGGFAAMTALVSLESVNHALRHRFSGAVAEANVAAAAAAFDHVVLEREGRLRAPAG